MYQKCETERFLLIHFFVFVLSCKKSVKADAFGLL